MGISGASFDRQVTAAEEAIASLRQVKHPDSPIYVAGVIGWPEPGASTQSEYRIDRAPDTGKWALSPICRAPSIEGDGGNVYPAYRLKQFIDAFPRIGGERLSPSMCGVDPWELALMPLGSAMPMTPFPGCVADPLIDRDPNIPDTQPDCQVSLTIPGDDEGEQPARPARRCFQATFSLTAGPAGAGGTPRAPADPSLTRGSECLPCALTIGTLLKTLRKQPAGGRHAFFMPSSKGPCRFG